MARDRMTKTSDRLAAAAWPAGSARHEVAAARFDEHTDVPAILRPLKQPTQRAEGGADLPRRRITPHPFTHEGASDRPRRLLESLLRRRGLRGLIVATGAVLLSLSAVVEHVNARQEASSPMRAAPVAAVPASVPPPAFAHLPVVLPFWAATIQDEAPPLHGGSRGPNRPAGGAVEARTPPLLFAAPFPDPAPAGPLQPPPRAAVSSAAPSRLSTVIDPPGNALLPITVIVRPDAARHLTRTDRLSVSQPDIPPESPHGEEATGPLGGAVLPEATSDRSLLASAAPAPPSLAKMVARADGPASSTAAREVPPADGVQFPAADTGARPLHRPATLEPSAATRASSQVVSHASSAGTTARNARIVIHYNPAQGRLDPRIIETLRSAGFGRVETRTVAFEVSSFNVRYFHDSDRRLVQQIATALAGSSARPIQRDFTHYTPRPSPGTVELWVGR